MTLFVAITSLPRVFSEVQIVTGNTETGKKTEKDTSCNTMINKYRL